MELYNKIQELLNELEEAKKQRAEIINLAKQELKQFISQEIKQEASTIQEAITQESLKECAKEQLETLKENFNGEVKKTLDSLKLEGLKELPSVIEESKSLVAKEALKSEILNDQERENLLKALESGLKEQLKAHLEKELPTLKTQTQKALDQCLDFVVSEQNKIEQKAKEILANLEQEANTELKKSLIPLVKNALQTLDYSFLAQEPQLLKEQIRGACNEVLTRLSVEEIKGYYEEVVQAQLDSLDKRKELATRELETQIYSLSILQNHALKILQDQSMRLEHQYLKDWEFVSHVRELMAKEQLLKKGIIEMPTQNTKAYEVS
ncbi:hypothetical protein [Helicobacter suis]|uniref:hypothetical protein n=1 Tax=Helicobacter suis TaxID=104628 RepID=UPI0013D03F12|nr:hypothetical protein [Helicobacter suis]